MNRMPSALAFSATILLAACGGGGDDAAPEAGSPTTAAPAASAGAPVSPPASGASPAPVAAQVPVPVQIAPGTPASPPPSAAVPPGSIAPPPATEAPVAAPVQPEPPVYTPPPEQPPVAQPTPGPVVPPTPASPVVRTDMVCQNSLDGTGEPWNIAFEIDTTEKPYKNFWSYADPKRGSHFEVDPDGAILNKRGRGTVPTPSRAGGTGQPQYYATVFENEGVTTVSIGSMYYPWWNIYSLKDGRVLRALRTAGPTTPGTLCYPNS